MLDERRGGHFLESHTHDLVELLVIQAAELIHRADRDVENCFHRPLIGRRFDLQLDSPTQLVRVCLRHLHELLLAVAGLDRDQGGLDA